MPLTLDGLNRPKIVTTNTLSLVLSLGTPTEVDTAQEESILIPFNLASQTPSPFTVPTCTTVLSSATVTTTGGGFSSVRVGDPVTGTGIAASSTVTSKTADNNTIVLNNVATAAGTVTLTFTPAAVAAPCVYAIRVLYTKFGASASPSFSLLIYDGTQGGAAPTTANATRTIPLTSSAGTPIPAFDFDAFLNNLRVPRLT
jgi:hypothetical protein